MKSAVLAYGFRPHFLLAGLAAFLLVPVWALSYVAGMRLGNAWPPTLWHAHEMLFGFIACAIAGFLLTAVPSWTGQKGFAGKPLAALAAVWLLGRILIASSAWWPPLLTAAADLAFLPLLDSDPPRARHALILGIDLVLVLVTVIGGRIIPAFTSSGLRQSGIPAAVPSRPLLTVLAVASMVLVAAGDVFWPEQALAGVLAAGAAVVQGLRLAQWKTTQTLRQPIVWVLHLAYAWLPLGLGLKATALLGGYAFSAFWLHALTIGTLATMIVAVMTRASLGHTGRPLVVHPLITLAYLLLTAAALVRVFGLAVPGLNFPQVIVLSALLWTASFALYLVIYAPILWGPRADGKPG